MRKGSFLGEFEQLCLLAVVRLGNNAYGVTILEEIQRRAEREPNIGSIYATLERLEEKGFVSSQVGEATAIRGGRPKRYFKISASGIDALERTLRMQDSMREGIKLRPGLACGQAISYG